MIGDGATIGDGLIAIAAVLPATIAAIAGLIVTVRARKENRDQHAEVKVAVAKLTADAANDTP